MRTHVATALLASALLWSCFSPVEQSARGDGGSSEADGGVIIHDGGDAGALPRCVASECVRPPAPACVAADVLAIAAPAGRCFNDECTYLITTTRCPFGCANATCQSDPCAGVACTTPPAATCTNDSTLRTYSPGACAAGACTYPHADLSCAAGCAHGACSADPCAGVLCMTPPAAACVSDSQLRSYSPNGVCVAGVCTYMRLDSTCTSTETCAAAACQWSDARLTALSVSAGALLFSPNTRTYAVTIGPSTTTMDITATVAAPTRMSLRINGVTATSGTATTVALGPTPFNVSIQLETESGAVGSYAIVFTRTGDFFANQRAYVKASNTGGSDGFGTRVALSADGSTLAVSAFREDSAATGVNGTATDDSANRAGAVYVFTRLGNSWAQQSYVKASNTAAGDSFGVSLALSADGSTLAVGASDEDSSAQTVNGDQTNDDAPSSGAVYVFDRAGASWSQHAYVKAPNAQASDAFGAAVALSSDGSVLAVGAFGEASAATGVGGDQLDDTRPGAGAAYVFERSGASWVQQAYLKASNSGADDWFGLQLALSGDGLTLAVAAPAEDSAATGIDGNQSDNSGFSKGAVYVFSRSGGAWAQQAYVKASNTPTSGDFGTSVALSHDGNTLAVGAIGDKSSATGLDGTQTSTSAPGSGAVYLFSRAGLTWTQQAYVKASNTDAQDQFGSAVSLSAAGDVLAVGAPHESSAALGWGGDETDNASLYSGAVYLFTRATSRWSQRLYVKASNTDPRDGFGRALALSSAGTTLAVGAEGEGSGATGVGGDQAGNDAPNAGAVYVFSH